MHLVNQNTGKLKPKTNVDRRFTKSINWMIKYSVFVTMIVVFSFLNNSALRIDKITFSTVGKMKLEKFNAYRRSAFK